MHCRGYLLASLMALADALLRFGLAVLQEIVAPS